MQKIRETCGENILEEGKRPGLLKVFLSQFANLLIVILDPAPWGTEDERGKKTIYDPCPAGWRVAPADTWTGIGYSDIGSWYNLLNLVWKTTSGSNYFLYFGGMTGATTFLPVSGFRNGSDALIKGIGTNAYLWMASPCGPEYTMACVMYAGTDQIHIAHAGKRSLGFSARCVKEVSLK